MANSRSRRSSRSVGRFDYRALTLIVFSFVMLLFIIIGPKTPVHRALNATGDGEGSWEGLVISEVMSDNESALPDENGTFCDWIEIWNSSDEMISLENVSLSNRSDRSKFIFPAQVLAPGEKVIVYCNDINRNTAGEAYHAKFKLSSLGCTVFMFDPSGKQIDSVTVPTLNTNESYSRMEDGRFEVTEQYTPGYPNTEDGHVLYLANYTIEADTLYINEVMAAPRSGLRDEDGELSDWLELYNASNERIYLRNYALSNNGAKLLKWFFPDDAYIEPGQYYVVFCSGKDRDGAETGYPHTNFRLSAEKETIYLSNRLGSLVDVMTWDNLSVDCSYGRVPGSNGRQVFTLATPGAPNNSEGAALADKYLRAINKTGIYITEVMSSNDVIKAASDSPNKDWVELYNSTTAAVDVSGWGLSDNINWPRKWQFPEGTVLWPGQYKIVMLDGADGVSAGGTLHTSFRLLRAGGEVITLSDATGYVLDKIALPLIPTDYSYGRTLGLGSFFYYDTPTPGGANGTGFGGFTEAPAFMTRGGLFSSNVEVEIVVPAGTTVRYTTDGTVPTVNNGTVYTGPFTITGTTAVRARAFVGGDRKPSDTITATYVLKTYYSLPVVCLVTDPDNLWNESTGIFAAGAGIDLASYSYIPFKHPSPVYRIQKEAGVKVSSYAEMYRQGETDPVFSQGVEIGIIGQYSLDMPQKSIKIHAKARYGSKYINGAVFEDRPFTQYRALVLRNSGNDCVWTRMVDGVQSRLADKIGTTVVHQAWQPVIVYINGQYWGHYNLRERVGEYMVAQHEGVPLNEAKSIDVLESNGTSKSQINNGSNEEWKEFIATVKTLSPGRNEADLQYILDRVDVDNYFDYVILESFFANTDTGNIRFYKVPGGKWRWIMYDFDYGLFNSDSNGIANYLNPKGHGANDDIDNSLILKLLENKQMKDKFLTRFGEIFRILNTDTMLAQIEECYRMLAPEMDMHFDRWASENLKNISADQPQTKDGCLRYWNTRVERLRNVVRKRPAYCWRQVAEWFKMTDAEMEVYFGPIPLISTDATWNSTSAENKAMTYLYGPNWKRLYE